MGGDNIRTTGRATDKVSKRQSFFENLPLASLVGHESEATLGEALLKEDRTMSLFLVFVGIVLLNRDNKVDAENTNDVEQQQRRQSFSTTSDEKSPVTFSTSFRRFNTFWYWFVRLCVAFLAVLSLVFFSSTLKYPSTSESQNRENLVSFSAMFLQSLSIIFSTFSLSMRMQRKFPKYVLPFFSKNIRFCLWFLGGLVCIALLTPIMLKVQNDEDAKAGEMEPLPPAIIFVNFIILAFPECFIAALLSGNLLFVLADADAALALIEEMLTHKHRVTRGEFELIRNEIEANIKETFCVNLSSTIIAFVNILAGVIVAFTHQDRRLALFFGLESFFAKELIFLIIVFWRCSDVNERSDELVKALGELASKEPTPDNVGKYIYASIKPVSYRLGGIRMTKRDMAVQALLLVGSIVFALMQTTLDINFPWEKNA